MINDNEIINLCLGVGLFPGWVAKIREDVKQQQFVTQDKALKYIWRKYANIEMDI